MSTCNFSRPHTSYHYAFCMNSDDEFEYEDTIMNVKSELEAIGGNTSDTWISRDTKTICEFPIDIYDHEDKEWFLAKIYVTVESGYYEGAMFDIDKSETEQYTISNTTEKKINTLWKKIEKILASYTMHLLRVATFSNGEAIYQQVHA